jgi:hypothetical protein
MQACSANLDVDSWQNWLLVAGKTVAGSVAETFLILLSAQQHIPILLGVNVGRANWRGRGCRRIPANNH